MGEVTFQLRGDFMDEALERLEELLRKVKQGEMPLEKALRSLNIWIYKRLYLDIDQKHHREALIRALNEMDPSKYEVGHFWGIIKKLVLKGYLQEVKHFIEEGLHKFTPTRVGILLIKEMNLHRNLSDPERRKFLASLLLKFRKDRYRSRLFWSLLEELAKYEDQKDNVIKMAKEGLPYVTFTPDLVSITARLSRFDYLRPHIDVREAIKKKEALDKYKLVANRKKLLKEKIEELRSLRLESYPGKIKVKTTKNAFIVVRDKFRRGEGIDIADEEEALLLKEFIEELKALGEHRRPIVKEFIEKVRKHPLYRRAVNKR